MTPDEIDQLEAYLRRTFGHERFEVKAGRKNGEARVSIGSVPIGRIVRDDEDEDISYNFAMTLPRPEGGEAPPLEPTLRTVLGNEGLTARGRTVKDGSVEIYLDDEFIGVVSNNDGAHEFDMAILDYDLEGEEA